ncbi:MAG TPA: mechanosensitive ion channel domain-containing protein [Anaerolineales bacterium]
MRDRLTEWVAQVTGLTPDTLGRIFTTLIVLIFLWLLYQGLLSLLRRRMEDVRIRYTWQKAAGYIIVVLGFFLLGSIWFVGFGNASTYLGLITAGLAIALKDLVTGFAGWVFILWNRPFAVGDRIQIGNICGDVIDLGIFQFTLLEIRNWVDADQSTGRIVRVPNGRVFSETVANFESGFHYIWNEIPIALTLDSNWQEARTILQEIANKHAEHLGELAEERVKEASRRYMIYYTSLTPTVYLSVGDKGVLLTVRYLCEPRLRRNSENAIWEDILLAFAGREDIHIWRN